MLNELRWQLFKALSWIGWKVCPEPHRTRLQSISPTWADLPAHDMTDHQKQNLKSVIRAYRQNQDRRANHAE